MNKFQNFVGIDVSKEHLDFAIFEAEKKQAVYLKQIANTAEAICALLEEILTNKTLDNTIFCMEATGYYSNFLAYILLAQNAQVWVENPLQIKRSLGLQRGKNDQVDAQRIAQYAYRFQDNICLYVPPSEEIQTLQHLARLRENMVSSLVGIEATLSEAETRVPEKMLNLMKEHTNASVLALQENIKKLENASKKVIEDAPELKENYDLTCSVVGIGHVTAVEIIITTENFTRFDDPRKYACYCGVAPYEHSSGKIKSRKRVSKMANMRLKKLFHMCAMSAVKVKNGELRSFYERKIAEGKAKMNALNAVRNKLIHRIFACVRKKEPYEKNYKNTLTTQ